MCTYMQLRVHICICLYIHTHTYIQNVGATFDDQEMRSSSDNSAMMMLTHKVNITHYALDAICNGMFCTCVYICVYVCIHVCL